MQIDRYTLRTRLAGSFEDDFASFKTRKEFDDFITLFDTSPTDIGYRFVVGFDTIPKTYSEFSNRPPSNPVCIFYKDASGLALGSFVHSVIQGTLGFSGTIEDVSVDSYGDFIYHILTSQGVRACYKREIKL